MFNEASKAILNCMSLLACKRHKAQPRYSEKVPYIERNGNKVYETLNGLYLKVDEIGHETMLQEPLQRRPMEREFRCGDTPKLFFG